jgi:hypothetical protein
MKVVLAYTHHIFLCSETDWTKPVKIQYFLLLLKIVEHKNEIGRSSVVVGEEIDGTKWQGSLTEGEGSVQLTALY